MAFDFSRLVGRIVEKFGSRSACAKAAGIPEAVLYSRLSNKTHFDAEEIYALSAPNCLDIPAGEISSYFFTPKVQ